ncbi:nociceptin receptor-like [Haliotis rufescens]|uniref:nociceptin receptor-like n=1 Tax=Haliotis rufescens TaxID=6454 RepID=UPI00201F133F|nr:nociceptin receptor-like [Haliotis rufescens]
MAVTVVPLTMSYNMTELFDNMTGYGGSEPPSYVFVRRLQTVMFPIICIAGTVGNCLAVGAFFSKSLRNTSCCLYLGVKSLSDIGFLISVFIIFLFRVRVGIMSIQGICQITIFLSYVCPFLSIWLVVVITFENFIRISQPALVPRICTTRMAQMVIFIYITVSLAVYNFPFWTTGVDYGMCSPLPQFQQISIVYTYVDSLLTLVLPLVLMVILVPLVTVSALQAHKRKMRLQAGKQRKDKKASPEAQVTRLLFAVSIVFIVLHTPSHSIRIKELVMQLIYNVSPSFNDLIVHRIFEMFYYLDFCVSLAVYLIFGGNFRNVFKKKYFSRCNGKEKEKEPTTLESPVSQRLIK